MINNVKDFTETDRQEALQKVNDFLKQSCPRELPVSFKKYCVSLMKCFDISSSIIGVIGLILLLVVVFSKETPKSLIFIFPGIIVIFLLICLVYFVTSYQRRLNILSSGKIHQASISSIEKAYVAKFQIPVYRLDLNVRVDSSTKLCHSYVRDEVIKHFYDIMNSNDQNNVEVLYNDSSEVIMPLNLIYMETVIKMSSLYS